LIAHSPISCSWKISWCSSARGRTTDTGRPPRGGEPLSRRPPLRDRCARSDGCRADSCNSRAGKRLQKAKHLGPGCRALAPSHQAGESRPDGSPQTMK
jgi:hypothetical protein